MLELLPIFSALSSILNGAYSATQNPCDNYQKISRNVQRTMVSIDNSWSITQNELEKANCSLADLEQWKYHIQQLQGNYTDLSKANKDLTEEIQKKPQDCPEAQFIIDTPAVEVPLADLAAVRSKISDALASFYTKLNSDISVADMNNAIQSFISKYVELRSEAQKAILEIRRLVGKKGNLPK